MFKLCVIPGKHFLLVFFHWLNSFSYSDFHIRFGVHTNPTCLLSKTLYDTNIKHTSKTRIIKNEWFFIFFLLTISKINSVNAQIYSQWHCLECVQTRSFFWSVFSPIWTEYGEILRIYPHSVRMRENMDQKKLRIWALFTQCEDCWPWRKALIWKREFYVKYCVSSFFFVFDKDFCKKNYGKNWWCRKIFQWLVYRRDTASQSSIYISNISNINQLCKIEFETKQWANKLLHTFLHQDCMEHILSNTSFWTSFWAISSSK